MGDSILIETSPAEDAPDELRPRVHQAVGDEFEIIGVLGRGGMANVYLAHERMLQRMVALKVLHPVILASPGMRERFLREARHAAALGHRNVVPIHGLRESDGLIVLVLRAVMGRSLSAILSEEGTLSIPLVQRIITQVAGALAYSHSRGVIHRDIKPGNILIDEDGTVIVSDFGIAKALEAPDLTSTGSTIGTPAYMSPEQCEGRPVSPAADQYALGAVAYEMLTGKTPFGADTAMGLMYAQTHNTPTPVREIRAAIPGELAEAVGRMMEKDPAARWPTLDEMVRRAGRPIVEGLDDPYADELGRLARRNSPALRLAEAFSPSLVTTRRTDPDAATLLFTAPRSRGRWPWIVAIAAVTAAGLFWWPSKTEQQFPLPGRVTPPVAAPVESTHRPAPTTAPAPRRSSVVTDPRRDTTAARREIGKTILRYSRAVESRHIGEVIAAYPGLTPDDQRGWEGLFAKAPALHFDIAVGKITFQARGADADLRGFIAYTPNGTTRRLVEPWRYHAELALGPEGWRIVRIH
jgi:serine/threonine protein kinase